MDAENHYGQLIVIILPQDARGKRHQRNQHKKQTVDVDQHRIHILGINGNEKMMRAPIGENQSERKDIRKQNRKQSFNFFPQTGVIDRPPDCRQFDVENQNRHHDGKNSVGKLV